MVLLRVSGGPELLIAFLVLFALAGVVAAAVAALLGPDGSGTTAWRSRRSAWSDSERPWTDAGA